MSNSTAAGYSGDDFYNGHKHNDVFDACVLLATVVSSVSSLIMLCLLLQIYVINKRANKLYSNTFLSLLFYITVYQLIYDISFYYGVLGSYNAREDLLVLGMNIAQIIGGIASSFYSNVMAYTILHVIWFRAVVDMGDACCSAIVHCSVLLPAVATASIYVVAYVSDSESLYNTANLDVYYVLRLISIFVNFTIYFATLLSTSSVTRRFSNTSSQMRGPFSMVLRNLVGASRQNRRRGDTESAADEPGGLSTCVVDDAIATLVSRLKYYPLIQALARSGLSIYEYLYDWDFVVDGPIGKTQFGLQIYSALIAPSASLGYLMIFLILQPRAFYYLKGWFRGELYLDGDAQRPGSLSGKSVLTKKSSKRTDYGGGDDQRISFDYDSERGSEDSVLSSSGRSVRVSGRLLNGELRSSDASADDSATKGDAAAAPSLPRSDDELLRIIVTYDAARPKSGAEGWRSSVSRLSAALVGRISTTERPVADDTI